MCCCLVSLLHYNFFCVETGCWDQPQAHTFCMTYAYKCMHTYAYMSLTICVGATLAFFARPLGLEWTPGRPGPGLAQPAGVDAQAHAQGLEWTPGPGTRPRANAQDHAQDQSHTKTLWQCNKCPALFFIIALGLILL